MVLPPMPMAPVGSAFDYYRTSLASLFGRVDYQFKDRYLFNATVRRDGSSKFGADNKYAVFPALRLGLAYFGRVVHAAVQWLPV